MPDTWWGEGKAAVARDYRDRAAQPRLVTEGKAGAHPEDEGVGEQDALEAGDHRLRLQPPRRGRHGRHGATAGPGRDRAGPGRAGPRGHAPDTPRTRPGQAPRADGPAPAGTARALTEMAERAGRGGALPLASRRGRPRHRCHPLFCDTPCATPCPGTPPGHPLSCNTPRPGTTPVLGHPLGHLLSCDTPGPLSPPVFVTPRVLCHPLSGATPVLRRPLSLSHPLSAVTPPIPSHPLSAVNPRPVTPPVPCHLLPGASQSLLSCPSHGVSRCPMAQPPVSPAHGTATTPTSGASCPPWDEPSRGCPRAGGLRAPRNGQQQPRTGPPGCPVLPRTACYELAWPPHN